MADIAFRSERSLPEKIFFSGFFLLFSDTKEDTVALFGTTFYNTQKGGNGSGDVRVRRISDIYSAMVEAGVKLSPAMTKEGGYWDAVYASFLATPEYSDGFGSDPTRGLAVEPDVAPYLTSW